MICYVCTHAIPLIKQVYFVRIFFENITFILFKQKNRQKVVKISREINTDVRTVVVKFCNTVEGNTLKFKIINLKF